MNHVPHLGPNDAVETFDAIKSLYRSTYRVPYVVLHQSYAVEQTSPVIKRVRMNAIGLSLHPARYLVYKGTTSMCDIIEMFVVCVEFQIRLSGPPRLAPLQVS